MLPSYTSDMLCQGSRSNAEWFYKELAAQFECKEPQWLGIRRPLDHPRVALLQGQDGVYISMENYITAMPIELRMEGAAGLASEPQPASLLKTCRVPVTRRLRSSCRQPECWAGWQVPAGQM